MMLNPEQIALLKAAIRSPLIAVPDGERTAVGLVKKGLLVIAGDCLQITPAGIDTLTDCDEAEWHALNSESHG